MFKLTSNNIYIPKNELENKESSYRFAANELRYYLSLMLGKPFWVAEEQGEENGIHLMDDSTKLELSLSQDGFYMEILESSVNIYGKKRGILYGTYEFLEKIGCRFFTATCEKIPTLDEITLECENKKYEPAFEYRFHDYYDIIEKPKFMVKCRMNGQATRFGRISEDKRLGGNSKYAIFVHSFDKLVPISEFGETHPEYYALVDGKRRVIDAGRTQLCLTNPDVLNVVIERTRKELLEHPDCNMISISQNDWQTGCECEKCKESDQKEGSASGTLLRFVNAVAKTLESEFPNIIFDTLAYNYTRPAPKTIRNNPNVCVRLSSIEACFSHPFEKCNDESRRVKRPDGTTSSFIQDLTEWGKICNRMYIWDYTTRFSFYCAPHPNWNCLQPNLISFQKNNVKGVFEQANRASRGGVDFNELRCYLISKLLWDPYCDIQKHRSEFMEYYYGGAAPYLDQYLTLLCDVCEKNNIHVGFNDNLIDACFDDEYMNEYEKLFNLARNAVQNDALRLQRVEKNRLSIRFVKLKRKAMLENSYDKEEIKNFFSDWKSFGLSRIEEWCNLETTERAFMEGNWRGVSYLEHWTKEEPELL